MTRSYTHRNARYLPASDLELESVQNFNRDHDEADHFKQTKRSRGSERQGSEIQVDVPVAVLLNPIHNDPESFSFA